MVNCQIYIIILGSSASFAKSPIKRLAVHKVQPALAFLVQLYKIRSILRRILFSKVVNLRIGELRNLPDYKILQKHLNPESAECLEDRIKEMHRKFNNTIDQIRIRFRLEFL